MGRGGRRGGMGDGRGVEGRGGSGVGGVWDWDYVVGRPGWEGSEGRERGGVDESRGEDARGRRARVARLCNGRTLRG